ncbi:MAG: GH116 family glycosyl hydrolase [Gemmatimonadales bacterium]
MPTHRVLPFIASALLLMPGLRAGAVAAQDIHVPKFAIAYSPIALTGDVRPHRYLGVLGRRAAWLGRETGEAELWVHPIKLADDFQLAFRIPDYVEPVQGTDVARTVVVRPELTTITYSHATFTVHQHILVPHDAPGLLVLLDVETLRPLEVIVNFQTAFQYAWPAAFGGQYVFWNDERKAFILSESLRERNAAIGSPWASVASDHPAHALPDAPNTFVIPIDTVRARYEFVPIAIAAGVAPRDSVLRHYRDLIRGAHALYQEKLAHTTGVLNSTLSIDTPNDELDRALAWSIVNLDEAMVCNPDLGCGLVAGWGPSGTSTRPGFGWFFGGDAAINSFAMDVVGLWPQVADGLRFLAHYQREDGKIPHEISQAAAHIPWFTDYPYAYYHADTTPYWIVALWRYWRTTGDDALLEELWPTAGMAYAWCRTRDTDGDGVIENGPGNLGAIEIGALGENLHQDIYLAAVWIEALAAMAELAGAMGDPALAEEAATVHQRARATLRERYWREEEGHHAFGILQSGRTNDNLTVWPATAAAFHLLDETRADRTLTKLATDSVTADWGARILSTGSPLYDPMHYNNGAVWPFVTGFVVWGQYGYRRPWSAFPTVHALAQLTFDWARGRHPELLSGRYYRPLDTAVPQQFFATSMLASSVVYGLLGFEPDAPHGRARLAPQLPPHWSDARVTNLRVGETTLTVDIRREADALTVVVRRAGPAITLDLTATLPPGSERVASEVTPLDGRSAGRSRSLERETRIEHSHPLTAPTTTFRYTWDGGLMVEPPTIDLEPGQASRGIRILDFRSAGAARSDRWSLTVEGERGRTYRLRLHGVPVEADGAEVVGADGAVTTIGVMIPGDSGRAVHHVELRRGR